MLALHRFVVAPDRVAEFTEAAHAALAAFAARPGYRGGELSRAVDRPDHWCLTTRWESVGVYRRALGDTRVRLAAMPLFAYALDEPGAYEVLAHAEPGGQVTTIASDRAPEPEQS
ncbi:MAG TPA: antibiotic biosynthesis monooxygenase [Natronosporangium sp.]|nr:antibiotic biosynthesis monooxygenase [Natronosporangium sp.]